MRILLGQSSTQRNWYETFTNSVPTSRCSPSSFLKKLGTGFIVHIFTTPSPDLEAVFVSRMFSPVMLGSPHEDHVCGSAHGILAPHWYAKRGIPSGEEVKAKMVSLRGGALRVVLDEAEGSVKLGGQACILATGQLYL